MPSHLKLPVSLSLPAALTNMVPLAIMRDSGVSPFGGQTWERPPFPAVLPLSLNPGGASIGKQGFWTCRWPRRQGDSVGRRVSKAAPEQLLPLGDSDCGGVRMKGAGTYGVTRVTLLCDPLPEQTEDVLT